MNTDAGFKSEILRKDNPIIIAANRHLAKIAGIRLAYNADGYPAGQVLARNSVTGLYAKYDDAASAVATAKGVLLDELKAEDMTSASGAVSRLLYGGEVFKDKLTGLDANGETDLSAKTIVDGSGTSILSF